MAARKPVLVFGTGAQEGDVAPERLADPETEELFGLLRAAAPLGGVRGAATQRLYNEIWGIDLPMVSQPAGSRRGGGARGRGRSGWLAAACTST